MTDTNGGIVKYVPGLILCMILGCLALQWDQSIHKWQKDFQESEKILKANIKDGKPFLSFAEYTAKSDEKYKEKLAAFERGEIKEKQNHTQLGKDWNCAATKITSNSDLKG
jgi:hypothetical protein